MNKVRLVTAGTSGNADDFFEFAETAGLDDIIEAERNAYAELWDPATGAVNPEAVNRARALILSRTKNPDIRAMLKTMQTRMERMVGQLMAAQTEIGITSVVPLNFEQNGPGIPIPDQVWNPPRGLPAFYLGWGARAFTVQCIGVRQWTYATIPLIDFSAVTSPYAGILGGQRWMTLATTSTEYKCSPKGCHPRLIAGSVHLPASPMTMSILQVATIGADALAGHQHAIDIYYAQRLVCNPDQTYKQTMKTWQDDVTSLRQYYGPFATAAFGPSMPTLR